MIYLVSGVEVEFKHPEWTVRQLFHKKIASSFVDPRFNSDVIKVFYPFTLYHLVTLLQPMKIDAIMDQTLENLSGGEQQVLFYLRQMPPDIFESV